MRRCLGFVDGAAALAAMLAAGSPPAAGLAGEAVDFAFAPPEWQTAICLPDDPCKTLADRSGALLYHYKAGGREFGTRVSVEVCEGAAWTRQELVSPRVPIVRTFRAADGVEIVEEAFAVTDVGPAAAPEAILRRTDSGTVQRGWAHPGAGVAPALADIALHDRGPIAYEVSGRAHRIVLALCEGWWKEPGKRVQVLRVEGAEPVTVDTVPDIGPDKAAAFGFDGKDENGDGRIAIAVEAAGRGADKNTILNGLWVYPPGAKPDTAALLAGRPPAGLVADMGAAGRSGPPRNDVLLVRVSNRGAAPRTFEPKLIVDTTVGFEALPGGDGVRVNGHETIFATCGIAGAPAGQGARRAVPLAPLTVPAGGTEEFAVVYAGGGTIVREPRTLGAARAARERAIAYWGKAPLPFGRVGVPDAGIQALIDSSIRNIWQAREIKQGLPAFQVGPTCYRGLWIVDGAFLLEAAAMLGAGDQARSGVAYELTHQQSDGRIEVMQDYHKENGIVLWTCVRHARLTRDQAWLESVWPRLQRVAGAIRRLREESRKDDSTLNDGLMPRGIIDGGIHAGDEYTNPYWNLAGLRAFVDGARWLGRTDEADGWQREYDDFMAAFRRAAARDLRKDGQGNAYLPILLGEEGPKQLPQRAQWAFCHAVYPGAIFAADDPLVAGNLAMLEATEREGMVYGTGWDATGIWNYFASFYGHAWLWQGRGRKAAQVLYAFANHAAPTLVWREEQSLKGEKFRKVGDMPHNWASAEFIRLAIHLLALDRGDELHLLQGLPTEWLGPGMTTRLDGVATPFGPLTMALRVSPDGASATLDVRPLEGGCSAVIVHRPDGGVVKLDPAKGGRVSFGEIETPPAPLEARTERQGSQP